MGGITRRSSYAIPISESRAVSECSALDVPASTGMAESAPLSSFGHIRTPDVHQPPALATGDADLVITLIRIIQRHVLCPRSGGCFKASLHWDLHAQKRPRGSRPWGESVTRPLILTASASDRPRPEHSTEPARVLLTTRDSPARVLAIPSRSGAPSEAARPIRAARRRASAQPDPPPPASERSVSDDGAPSPR